ncbi:unnamed protein product [Symbiodinium microadriaticum]|nr:unnamed protein product [Symbiodinium microadriaticum]
MYGLTPMPDDWSGARNELKRCVIGLGDIDWDEPGMAVSEVTVSDVLEARRFWFPNGTIALMPDVVGRNTGQSGAASTAVELREVDGLCDGVGRALPEFGLCSSVHSDTSGPGLIGDILCFAQARLQELLRSMKLDHSIVDVYNAFKQREKDDKLSYASGDSKVASADQPRKLANLPRRAREALVDAARALAFAAKLSEHVAVSVKHRSDRVWNDKVTTVLNSWFTLTEEERNNVTFGCSDSHVKVLNIMADIARGVHMPTFYGIIATHDQAPFQVRLQDPRVQSIVADALKQPLPCMYIPKAAKAKFHGLFLRWRDVYEKPLAPVATVETVPLAAAALQSLSGVVAAAEEAEEPEQLPAAVPDEKEMEEKRASAKKAAVAAVARAEVARYLRFIVADPSDPSALKSVVEPQLRCSPSVSLCDFVLSRKAFKFWLIEECNYTKCFSSLATPKIDAFVTWDAGAQKAAAEIKKTMNKMSGQRDTIAINLEFVPKAEQDMTGNKRRKPCSLSSIVGRENMYLYVKGDALVARDFRFLVIDGVTINSAMPFFFAPLPDPSSQLKPLVTRADKQKILMDLSDKKNVATDTPMTEFLPEIGEEEEMLPLHFFMKSSTLCREALRIMRASTAVLLSPDPNMIRALLDSRITGLVVCRNNTHMKVLEEWLLAEVAACVLDPHDQRYHNADLVRKFQAPNPCVQAVTAATEAALPALTGKEVEGADTQEVDGPANEDASSSSSSSEAEEEAIYQACRISSRTLDATISDGKVPGKKRDRMPSQHVLKRSLRRISPAVWMGKQALAVTGTVAAEMVVVKGGPMISLEASLRQWRQEGRIADAKATAAQVEQLKKELAEAENLLAMQKSDLGDLLSESGGHRDMAAFEGAGDEGLAIMFGRRLKCAGPAKNAETQEKTEESDTKKEKTTPLAHYMQRLPEAFPEHTWAMAQSKTAAPLPQKRPWVWLLGCHKDTGFSPTEWASAASALEQDPFCYDAHADAE